MSVSEFLAEMKFPARYNDHVLLCDSNTQSIVPLSAVSPDSLKSLEYASSGLRWDWNCFIIIYH